MAYNFKSIADVEVVVEPTESTNVLIEENGVIKKVPKSKLDHYTIIYTGSDIIIPDGFYEGVVEKWFTNVTGVDINIYCAQPNDGVYKEVIDVIRYNEQDECISLICNSGACYYLYKDGRHNVYYD